MKELFYNVYYAWLDIIVRQDYVAVIILSVIGLILALIGMHFDNKNSLAGIIFLCAVGLYAAFIMFTVLLFVNTNVQCVSNV